ncbi:MAG: imidazolonepropionase [Candidatus Fermentibacteraceae bacterium]
MERADFLLRDIGQLLTLAGPQHPRRGHDASRISLIEDAAVAALDGKVVWTGPAEDAESQVEPAAGMEIHDAAGRVVTPGLVDSHTHPVFGATRQEEFAMRAAGADYEEIARRGGGILNSVRRTRETSSETMQSMMLRHLSSMLRHGTTTLEAKSGYGLDLNTEVRLLEVIRDASGKVPQTVVPTFLGAHEVPEEYREYPMEYIDLIISDVLPVVREAGLAAFVDVFCEKGVFTPAQSRRLLEAASGMGFGLKMHADEFHDTGGAELAAELGAVSADHLLSVSDDGVKALADSNTVATLLPGTALFLNKPFADARRLIDAGAAVALATDFNPGSCYCESMPFMINLGVCQCGMTVEEALVASTVNGAAAVGMIDRKGSLQPGRDADMILWNVDDYRSIAYHLAVDDIDTVFVGARVAARAGCTGGMS